MVLHGESRSTHSQMWSTIQLPNMSIPSQHSVNTFLPLVPNPHPSIIPTIRSLKHRAYLGYRVQLVRDPYPHKSLGLTNNRMNIDSSIQGMFLLRWMSTREMTCLNVRIIHRDTMRRTLRTWILMRMVRTAKEVGKVGRIDNQNVHPQ